MRFISADKIFDGEKFLPGESVLVLNDNGILEDLISGTSLDQGKIQKLKGVITPGFVNAHCHTELSHLRGKIPQKTGLPGFGKHIMMQRMAFPKEYINEQIQEADKEMYRNGIVAVGDICNTNDSFKMKEASPVFYHSFIELLGLHPERAGDSFALGMNLLNELKSMGMRGSLAPHAPYSTSLELIQKISDHNLQNNLPSSIHNQESEDESKFFRGEKNGFHDLYAFLQMDISWFNAPRTSSLSYYGVSLGNQQTTLVHNTFTSAVDLESVRGKNIYWCFCPAANLYIEDRLPDYKLFSGVRDRVCIGTDSLASNSGLSVIDEANIVLSNSGFSEEEVLQFTTSIPAKALQLQNQFGSLVKGKSSGLNLIEVKDRKFQFVKKLF